jgi:nucleotide-binding universal stress UspA family protein
MFHTIVVPLDGTPFAEHAVPTALMLARAGGGRVVLVHVYAPPPATDAYLAPPPDPRLLATLGHEQRQDEHEHEGEHSAHHKRATISDQSF